MKYSVVPFNLPISELLYCNPVRKCAVIV